MPEIGTSGSMSEDEKRRDATWPQRPRSSSTLPARRLRQRNGMSAIGGTAYVAAKLLARDEAWRIAVNKAAGAVDEASNLSQARPLRRREAQRFVNRRRRPSGQDDDRMVIASEAP